MAKRIVLAAVLGGLAMFIWGVISHMLIPFEDISVRNLPNEEAVVPVLRANIDEAGLYLFPGFDSHADAAATEAWSKKYMAGPVGLLVYSPHGKTPLSLSQMFIELLSNIFACLFVAIVVINCRVGFWSKAFLVTLFGVVAWCSISISYWNWYLFPGGFTLVEGIDQVFGFFFAGMAISWMQPNRA